MTARRRTLSSSLEREAGEVGCMRNEDEKAAVAHGGTANELEVSQS